MSCSYPGQIIAVGGFSAVVADPNAPPHRTDALSDVEELLTSGRNGVDLRTHEYVSRQLPTMQPRGYLGAATVPATNQIYAVGGQIKSGINQSAKSDGITNTVQRLDLMPTPESPNGNWQEQNGASFAVGSFGIGVIDETVYIVGGETQSSCPATLVYDTRSTRWDSTKPVPTARSFLAVGVIGDTLYAVGGYPKDSLSLTGTYVPTIEAYHSLKDSWSPALKPMLTARGDLAVATYGGALFAIGGRLNEVGPPPPPGPSNCDPTATPPQRCPGDKPCPKCGSNTCPCSGPNHTAVAGISNAFEAYFPSNDSWVKYPDMLTGRYGLGAAIVGDKLYAVGGIASVVESNLLKATSTVEIFDFQLHKWSKSITGLRFPRAYFGIAVIDKVSCPIDPPVSKHCGVNGRTGPAAELCCDTHAGARLQLNCAGDWELNVSTYLSPVCLLGSRWSVKPSIAILNANHSCTHKKCPAGTWWNTTTCGLCPLGSKCPGGLPGHAPAIQCPDNHEPTTLPVKCQQCSPGKVCAAGEKDCQPCVWPQSPNQNGSACECSPGFLNSSTIDVSCFEDDFSKVSAKQETKRTKCLPCPYSCVDFCNRDTIGIKRGYAIQPSLTERQIELHSVSIFRCVEGRDACLNVSIRISTLMKNKTTHDLWTHCGANHTGLLCHECRPGFAKLSGGTCLQCQELRSPKVDVILAASCVVVVLLLIGLSRHRNSIDARVARGDSETELLNPAGTQGLAESRLSVPSSDQPPRRKSWLVDFGYTCCPPLTIVLGFGQIIAPLGAVLNTKMPPTFSWMVQFLRSFTLVENSLHVELLACAFQSPFALFWLHAVIVPIVVLLFGTAILQFIGEPLQKVWNVFNLLCYPIICSSAFRLLDCRRLSLAVVVLDEDYSVSCESPDYITYKHIAWFFLLICGIGVPLAELHFAYTTPSKDEEAELRAKAKEVSEFFSKSDVPEEVGLRMGEDAVYHAICDFDVTLYSSLRQTSLKSGFEYFQFIFSIRKFIYVGALSAVPDLKGSAVQLILAAFISFCSVVLQMRQWPHRYNGDNILAASCEFYFFLVILTLMLLRMTMAEKDGVISATAHQCGLFLTLAAVIFVVAPLFATIGSKRRKLRGIESIDSRGYGDAEHLGRGDTEIFHVFRRLKLHEMFGVVTSRDDVNSWIKKRKADAEAMHALRHLQTLEDKICDGLNDICLVRKVIKDVANQLHKLHAKGRSYDGAIHSQAVEFKIASWQLREKIMHNEGTAFSPPPCEISSSASGCLQQVDIWGLGLLIFYCTAGRPLFRHKPKSCEMLDFKGEIRRCTWLVISDDEMQHVFSSRDCGAAVRDVQDAKHLIRWLLQNNPRKRPTIEQVLAHPLLKEDGSRPLPDQEMQYFCFLSHAQAEASGQVKHLHQLLKSLGCHCWLDMEANNLTEAGMERGIQNSRVFLLFLSKDVLGREFCQKEMRWALKYKKAVQLIIEEDPRFSAFDVAAWKTGVRKVSRFEKATGRSETVELALEFCKLIDDNLEKAVIYRRRNYESEAMARAIWERHGEQLPTPEMAPLVCTVPVKLFVICESKNETAEMMRRQICDRLCLGNHITICVDMASSDKVLVLLIEGVLQCGGHSLSQIEECLCYDQAHGKDRVCFVDNENAGWSFGGLEHTGSSATVKCAINEHESLHYREPSEDGPSRHEFPAMVNELRARLTSATRMV